LKVLGLIPARSGSKSVQRKNLTDLGGLPLIGWSIRSALESNLDRVVVSTDDLEISRVSQSFGAEVPFLRPQNLALDHSLTIDTVLHALDELGPGFDAVMLLQPTSPFRNATDINDALNMFIDCSSVISVVPVDIRQE
jgi:CMP-N-acetylneuraminic acid synthetase